jgi:diaminopimelate decarboxylase
MQYFNSDYFTYKNDRLYCEDISITEIVEKLGTPTYIYSKNYFIDRYNEFNKAFKDIRHTIFYACKSNFNISVIKTFGDLGSGVDVNSEGELIRALKAGISPKNIIFSGVGKTSEEIKIGIETGVLMLKAESVEEINLINQVASSLNKVAPIALRVNPDVDAESHPYISTGLAENKFGIESKVAFEIFKESKKFKNLKFVGIDMHIGSQITKIDPFVAAVEKLSELYLQIKSKGVPLEHFDIGGGIGIPYNHDSIFSLNSFAEALKSSLKKINGDIFFEPGRFLTANGGTLAIKVLYTKKNHNKNFIIVDGAMNDLLRPSIYGAYHHIQPVVKHENRKTIEADIVGPVCESGDFLAKKREFMECKREEYLAVMSAGAYGMTMASNYNARRRPAEVLVDGSKFKVIRSRETFDNLLFDEEKFL